jgi:arabinose-5-phosphate isomerase
MQRPERKRQEAAAGVESAKSVFDAEIQGLRAVRDRLGAGIVAAVEAIDGSAGRIVVSGVGKSGLVAKNIAATLTSTGTPSHYLHPVEAAHGDLGLVHEGDVVIIISKSGMSDELRSFVPAIKELGVIIIGMTSSRDSYLGQNSDIILDTHAGREAGSLGLAPTTSTTTALVMGHALASALSERKGFTAEDFARVHPSGILGKRVTLTVGEVMRKGDAVPLVHAETPLSEALLEIMEKSIGCTGVVDDDGILVGIITDGDLKRILASRPDALTVPVREVMTRDPKTIEPGLLAADALALMEMNKPGPLLMYFIVDDDGRPTGLLHLHDILRAGLSAE